MYNRQPNLTICFLLLYMFLIQNLHINVANALLYSQRISRDLSPPEIATSAPSENALWVFRMRINASLFLNHYLFSTLP